MSQKGCKGSDRWWFKDNTYHEVARLLMLHYRACCWEQSKTTLAGSILLAETSFNC